MIDLAISPCPNDTFIFYNMHRHHPEIELVFADVEELNQRALGEARHVLTKMSFYAILKASRYTLLSCGGALGWGSGPILLSGRDNRPLEDMKEILVPGPNTTACLLLDLYLSQRFPGRKFKRTPVRYDRILPMLRDGAEAGVIIHEERFTYPAFGLSPVQDLGAWWESETGLPIPLGGICARKDAGAEFAARAETWIRESLSEARANPAAVRPFVKQYSQSLEDPVIDQHIALYVNDFSFDMGETGRRAVDELEKRARAAGLC